MMDGMGLGIAEESKDLNGWEEYVRVIAKGEPTRAGCQ
jgi:hypothetical protein